MMDPPPVQPNRFVGLDVHKAYLVVAAVDRQQNVLLPPYRVDLVRLEDWARKHLYATDVVVLEATTNAWDIYDRLLPLVSEVVVANPLLVKLITSARVKTDAQDAVKLARLLAAGLIPPVWVPPKEVRELRALVSHRRRMVSQRTQARNRLRSILHRHDLTPPGGDPFSAAHRSWWKDLAMPAPEKLIALQNLSLLDALEPLIAGVEHELARLSATDRWANEVLFLVQLPGIGVLNAMTLLAAIGEISRFPSAKKLVGYSGLGTSVHDSGQTHSHGRITKQGRREIRSTMVEAAWKAVETAPFWQSRFEQLSRRLNPKKAIVAIARKLLVVVWNVLADKTADLHANEEKVARKMLYWGRKIGRDNRKGVETPTFIREQLNVLKLGLTLEAVSLSGRPMKLPPVLANALAGCGNTS